MYAIAGVSGNTGSVVAATLLAQHKPVRVIVRDAAKAAPWQARGAGHAVASIDDEAALTRALTGAAGAYLLLPPHGWTDTGIPAQRARVTASIVGAVRAAQPGHVVLLSSVGADHTEGTGPVKYLHPLEAGLRETGVPVTFLRAGSFIENWAALARTAIASGALHYGLRADFKFPQVATTDIGKLAARLLAEGAPAAPRVVELAGPADQSLDDTAAALARIAGKPVTAVSISPPAMIDALVGMGASHELAALYVELAEAINRGVMVWQGTPLRGAVTLEQRLRELLAAG